ncbi:MAG TPA: ABC transporter ATP-binding protein [candidate division Zixibacteria bacterium]|nr:ABC transporter ATP-binding protein [candidate division Zixibacteria bacterium]
MNLIEGKNLWKWYPSPEGRLDVLRGVDIAVGENDFIAIVGASGVGKSTLLHILGFLDPPSGGELFFAGKPAKDLSPDTLAEIRAKNIGFVFQFHHLLPEFTALENLLIPQMIVGQNSAKAKKKARQLLDSLGIGERADHLPAQLSGGEQQRVALARALINDPAVLIADEPTGNLDDDNSHKFMQILAEIRARRNFAVVLATHNMEIADYAEKIFRLRGGKLHPVK